MPEAHSQAQLTMGTLYIYNCGHCVTEITPHFNPMGTMSPVVLNPTGNSASKQECHSNNCLQYPPAKWYDVVTIEELSAPEETL